MDNKRGQGLPISTIILLILGIVILVFLIIGFSAGWDKFSSYFSKNNVKDVVSNCEIACSTNSQYDFCSAQRTLVSDTEKLSQVTCDFLNKQRPTYAVAGCASITCPEFMFVSSTDPAALTAACADNQNVGKQVQVYYLDKGVLKNYLCNYPACPVTGGDPLVAKNLCSGKKSQDKIFCLDSPSSSAPSQYTCTDTDVKL
ncbi:Uncharacterised protein [uncultured archaeon]|nr:Uncharacterised protein [uncultured archaeon]